MTKEGAFGYNITCHCVKACERTLPITVKGGADRVKNVSTEETSEKERARLQKKNEDCRWQKRPQKKTRKGQKETDLLIGQSVGTPKAIARIEHRLPNG